MDSINKNQPGENYKGLIAEESIKKIKELIEKANNCFFCTKINTGESFSTRPMSVQKIDDEGNIWFLSASDSKKNLEIESGSHAVQLLFQGSDYSDFLSLHGYASISRDRAKIKELWRPILKVWFTEGEDDPRITVIKVAPAEGYYWDTKHSSIVGIVKRIAGAIAGKTYDDSIEGAIKV